MALEEMHLREEPQMLSELIQSSLNDAFLYTAC